MTTTACAAAAGLLWFGMMCAVSKMRVWSKVLWLLLLIPTSSIGALIKLHLYLRESTITKLNGV